MVEPSTHTTRGVVMTRNMFRKPGPLFIRELAVDPADVDHETYPVTLRLSRSLSANEITALSTLDSHCLPAGDAIVIADAKIDDVARAHAEWAVRLETIQRVADEIAGEALLAQQRRAEHQEATEIHINDRHDTYPMG